MKKIIIMASAVLLALSCTEMGRLDQTDSSDSIPLQVSITEIRPTSGGAILKFALPDDLNLRGVRAEYKLGDKDVFTQVSKYVDSLKVEGFADTLSHTVRVYSFGKNRKMSAPVVVDVKPAPPATMKVRFTLKDTFGGIRMIMNGNDDNTSLAITILQDNNLEDFGKDPSDMEWEELYTYYTEGSDVAFTRYGLDTQTRIFGVFARDRWMNFSDTTYFQLTPLKEEYLDNSLWKIYTLPGDETECLQGTYQFHYMFDGKWSGNKETAGIKHGGLKRMLTVDMGYTASLSRMRMQPRGTNPMTSAWTPWHWQIWGSMDPNPDGSFDGSWYLLGDFEQYKPSGFNPDGSFGTLTEEDNQYFFNNNDYEFVQSDNVADPQREARYFRLVFLQNYTYYFREPPEEEPTNVYYLVGELMFWGQKK